jgi:hypothetical protein
MEIYPLVYMLNTATVLPYIFHRTNMYVLVRLVVNVLCNFVAQLDDHGSQLQ